MYKWQGKKGKKCMHTYICMYEYICNTARAKIFVKVLFSLKIRGELESSLGYILVLIFDRNKDNEMFWLIIHFHW